MPVWLRDQICPPDLLAQGQALQRAGKVFNVVRVQSPRPHVLQASIRLYTEVMHSPRSPLTRTQRELIATVVSQVNACHY